MRCNKDTAFVFQNVLLLSLLVLPHIYCAAVKDIFNLNSQPFVRLPRDNKYYLSRYGSSSSNEAPLSRSIKPEESPEARENAQSTTPVEKRCIRCESGYLDSRYPSESRPRYDDRRVQYRDYDRYDRYDRYDDRDRYDRYDRYNDRDRYSDRYDRDRYDRYDNRDRYESRDRYDPRDRYYDRSYDRGVGYDNRGYDNRGYTDQSDRYDRGGGYRPYDETYRGSSGYDSSGRGYYFASGRPDYGSGYGSGGGGYGGAGGGYASSWNYGRDDYRDRDRGYGGSSSYGGASYRPRDPYYDGGYRSTSYLYGRPSSTTTDRPSNSDNDSGITQSSQQENPSG